MPEINPLQIRPPPGTPEANNPLAPEWMRNIGSAAADWMQRQHVLSQQMGLEDPATGLPTALGLRNALAQYSGALVAGSGGAGKGSAGRNVYADQVGKPVTMYHGTKMVFDEFKPSLTLDDHVPGISVTRNPNEAASYGDVLPVHIHAENPITYSALEDFAAKRAGKVGDPEFSAFDVDPHTLLVWLKDAGYDAIDYTSDPLLGYGIRVFNPEQITRAK